MVSWELHLCFHSEGKHLGAIPSVRSAEGMLGAAHSGDRTINRRETHQSCPCNVETFQMRTLKKASETLIPARPVFRTKKTGQDLSCLQAHTLQEAYLGQVPQRVQSCPVCLVYKMSRWAAHKFQTFHLAAALSGEWKHLCLKALRILALPSRLDLLCGGLYDQRLIITDPIGAYFLKQH